MDNTYKNYLTIRRKLFNERFHQAVDYLNSVYSGVCIFVYKPISYIHNDKPIIDYSHINLGVIEYSDIFNQPYVMPYGSINITQSYDSFIKDLNHHIQYALKHIKHN